MAKGKKIPLKERMEGARREEGSRLKDPKILRKVLSRADIEER